MTTKPSTRRGSLALVGVSLPMLLSGCTVIGDIFKAGVWVGVVVVVFALAIVGGIAALFTRGSRN